MLQYVSKALLESIYNFFIKDLNDFFLFSYLNVIILKTVKNINGSSIQLAQLITAQHSTILWWSLNCKYSKCNTSSRKKILKTICVCNKIIPLMCHHVQTKKRREILLAHFLFIFKYIYQSLLQVSEKQRP